MLHGRYLILSTWRYLFPAEHRKPRMTCAVRVGGKMTLWPGIPRGMHTPGLHAVGVSLLQSAIAGISRPGDFAPKAPLSSVAQPSRHSRRDVAIRLLFTTEFTGRSLLLSHLAIYSFNTKRQGAKDGPDVFYPCHPVWRYI